MPALPSLHLHRSMPFHRTLHRPDLKKRERCEQMDRQTDWHPARFDLQRGLGGKRTASVKCKRGVPASMRTGSHHDHWCSYSSSQGGKGGEGRREGVRWRSGLRTEGGMRAIEGWCREAGTCAWSDGAGQEGKGKGAREGKKGEWGLGGQRAGQPFGAPRAQDPVYPPHLVQRSPPCSMPPPPRTSASGVSADNVS